MKRVIVRISKDGSKTTVEVNGVAGPSCETETAELIARIGTVEKSGPTDDYYKSETELVPESY